MSTAHADTIRIRLNEPKRRLAEIRDYLGDEVGAILGCQIKTRYDWEICQITVIPMSGVLAHQGKKLRMHWSAMTQADHLNHDIDELLVEARRLVGGGGTA